MKKKLLMLLLCTIITISLSGCGNNNQVSNQENGKVKVVVSFNAMKEFTQVVGGNKVEISTIVPDGTKPHDFEPKAQDLTNLSTADIFVYNGLGMENWVDDAIGVVNNKNLVLVEASKGVTIINNTGDETDEQGQYDPHTWLGLKEAIVEAKNIKDALVEVDPTNKEYYEKNYNDFATQLDNLYSEYNNKFQTLQTTYFVTGHAAFAYLCQDFGLIQNSIEDVYAEGEPSAQQIIALVEYCKSSHVTTIFAEEMASTDVSKTLANEVGAKVETIYTIESNEDNKTYIERMESNLSKIYNSLAK